MKKRKKTKESFERSLRKRLICGFLRDNFQPIGVDSLPFTVKGMEIEEAEQLGKGTASGNDQVLSLNFPLVGTNGAFRPTVRWKLTDLSEELRPENVLASAIGQMRLMTEANTALQKAGEDAAAKMPGPVVTTIVLDDGTLHHLPLPARWRYISTVSMFERHAESFHAGVQKRVGDHNPTEAEIEVVRNIARTQAIINRIKPQSENVTLLKRTYKESLTFVLAKATAWHTTLEPHPLLSEKEIDRFYALVRRRFKAWGCPFERLARSWGDFNLTNALIDPNHKVLPIDPRSEPGWWSQWADPGVDVGWFFGELWWYACLHNSRFYRDLAILYLRFYEEESKDSKITKAIVIGLAWRCALRMNTIYSSSEELGAARPFVTDMWRWIEAGEVDV